MIRNAKHEYEKVELATTDETFKRISSHYFYHALKSQLSGYQAPLLCCQDENRYILQNNCDNCEWLAQYFESLLYCPPPASKIYLNEPSFIVPNSFLPNQEEIDKIIKYLPKTSEKHSILTEHLKMADSSFVAKMETLFYDIWTSETITREWQSALIHTLHKKKNKKRC